MNASHLDSARVGLVVNPERASSLDDVTARLGEHGVAARIEQPSSADGIRAAAEAMVASGARVVAAVGGDGTQRAVAAALSGSDAALAVVPGGTVNLLGRVLGIDDLDVAVAAIAGGERRSIDLGELTVDGGDRPRTFVLNASSGWDAAVIDRVDDGYKRFGRLGYVAAGLRQWFAERPHPVNIGLDGRPWYGGEALTVLVLNVVQRGSTAFDLAPASSHDDGRLDVVVVRRRSVLGLLRAAWAVLRGHEPRPSDVVRATAEHVAVTWDRPVAAQLDGDEIAAGRSFDHRVRPAALSVVVPKADDDRET